MLHAEINYHTHIHTYNIQKPIKICCSFCRYSSLSHQQKTKQDNVYRHYLCTYMLKTLTWKTDRHNNEKRNNKRGLKLITLPFDSHNIRRRKMRDTVLTIIKKHFHWKIVYTIDNLEK